MIAQGVEWAFNLSPHLSAGFALISPDAVDPYIMVDQDWLQWLDLVQVATVIGVGGVVEGAGGVTLHTFAYGGTGVDDVQAQQLADLPLEPDGLGEVETGIDEIDRDLLADAADYMQ